MKIMKLIGKKSVKADRPTRKPVELRPEDLQLASGGRRLYPGDRSW